MFSDKQTAATILIAYMQDHECDFRLNIMEAAVSLLGKRAGIRVALEQYGGT